MRALFYITGALVIGMIVFTAVFNISGYSNKQAIRTKVTGKERITEKSGDNLESYYLVYTESGTFKLEDDLIYGNFNSSDWYGQIRQDSTYTFHIVGFRIGYMNSYPNIVKFEK